MRNRARTKAGAVAAVAALAVASAATGDDFTVSRSGAAARIVRVALKSDTLFWSGAATDPALYASWDAPQLEFHYITCARLLNYPDRAGDAGRGLVPEVAAGFPKVSTDGRTYTFRIRKGYRFSPPSNEPVTAEAFRHTIERVLSPKFAWFEPTAADIVGARAYHTGRALHVAGLSAHGNSLVIHLVKPAPDLPWRLSLSPYCVVPLSTPVAPHGIEAPIPSAGPYYLAAHTDSSAVLKRNPNYHGSRPHRLDEIRFTFGVAAGDAAAGIARGTFDYVAETDPALAPSTRAARSAGGRYRLTSDATGSTKYLAFNTGRPLFRRIRMRRAVEYALDRRALAATLADAGGIPATRILSPRLPGFRATPIYPLGGDVRRARKLADGARLHAVFAAPDPATDPSEALFIRAVRRELAAIGLATSVITLTNADFENGTIAAKAARSDLISGGANANTGDPVAYLRDLFLPSGDRADLARIASLSSPRREERAAALATKIDHQALFAVYANGAMPTLVSARVGCIVHQPEYAGIDLAALCLKGT